MFCGEAERASIHYLCQKVVLEAKAKTECLHRGNQVKIEKSWNPSQTGSPRKLNK